MSDLKLLLLPPEPWFRMDLSASELQAHRFLLDDASPRLSLLAPEYCEVWDVEDGLQIGRCQRQSSKKQVPFPFRQLICRPGMEWAVFHVTGRKTVEILHTDSFTRSHFLRGPQSHIRAVALSPCNEIVVALDQEQIYLWHISDPEPVEVSSAAIITSDSARDHIMFSPNGQHLVCYCDAGGSGIYVWDMKQRTWLEINLYLKMYVGIPRLAFAPDCRALYVFSRHANLLDISSHDERDDLPDYAVRGIEDSQCWRIDLETGGLSVVDQTFESAAGLQMWCKGAAYSHNAPKESGFWNVSYHDGRMIQLPASCHFASLTSDARWLVMCCEGALYRFSTASLWEEAVSPSTLGSSLHDLAQRLRTATLGLGDAVDLLEDNELLLRWFAIECATYGLLQAERHGLLTDKSQRENARLGGALLEQCQRFALDSLSSQEQEDGKDVARGLLYLDDSIRKALYGAIGARRASNAVRASRNAAPQRWRCHRLAFLCELWATCGDRAPWLLWEDKCPLDVPPEASFDYQEADATF